MSFDEEGRNYDLDFIPPAWTFQRHVDVSGLSCLHRPSTGRRPPPLTPSARQPADPPWLCVPLLQRYDFMAPHYYSRPDKLCSTEAAPDPESDRAKIRRVVSAPWEARARRAFSRFAPFCRSAKLRMNKTDFAECPRRSLSYTANETGRVNDVELDIGPTSEFSATEGSRTVKAAAKFIEFGESRYVVVADGWVSSAFAAYTCLGGSARVSRTAVVLCFARQAED